MGLRIVPYGIDSNEPVAKRKPIQDLLGTAYGKSWKILWFGAVYPWFNIKKLIDAVHLLNEKHPTQLIMVGASNPFNNHPDFVEKAREVRELVTRPEFKEIVHTQDWVPFEDRADWYLDCDLIITLNEPGMENGLSWRTRVADYVWAGMPIASNGGDPLTEGLIAQGAAGRLEINDAASLAESIRVIMADEARLKTMKAQMQLYRPTLYWDNVVKPLGEIIERHNLAADRIS
jgi:glycosyltransferase involved in cell wall biosynthesis